MSEVTINTVSAEIIEGVDDSAEASLLLSIKLKNLKTVADVEKEVKKYEEYFKEEFLETLKDIWSEVEGQVYRLNEER